MKKWLRQDKNEIKKAEILCDSGKEYTGSKGVMKKRSVQPYLHNCRYDCKSFTKEERSETFKYFWGLKSWNLQTAFINGLIVKYQPKRVSKNTVSHKQVSVILKLKTREYGNYFY